MVVNAVAGAAAPLMQTFARVRAGNPWLQVHIEAPRNCPVCDLAALLDDDSLIRDEQFALMPKHYGTDDPDILARFYFGSFCYMLASATVSAFAVDRRAPVLHPERLRVALGSTGRPEALVLPDAAFWCLPDDPAAGHPDARVIADEATLRALLLDRLSEMFALMIAVTRRRARVGARALWISAAETCASTLVDGLPPEVTQEQAQAAVQTLIGTPGVPLRAKPEVITLHAAGRPRLMLLGDDCCTNFKIPGETYCESCPHLPREQRIASLQTWWEGQVAEAADSAR
ncbi:MAG: hypothetical protein QM692_12840 [Thermomicrobiales bacterium]